MEKSGKISLKIALIFYILSSFTLAQPVLQWPPAGSTSTSGWLETTWNQTEPYKDACPFDSLKELRSAVGCIGTALAQVINYHRKLGGLRFTANDRYVTTARDFRIDQDSLKYGFPGFGELNDRLARIEDKYQLQAELDSSDLAALCFAVGIAIQMEYTGPASTIYLPTSVSDYLKKKFKYGSAEALIANINFYEQLVENIINGQPAILYLTDHAIVADGYRSDGYIHLNFGQIEGNPDHISKTWYRPDSLPCVDNKIVNGILNIRPASFTSNLKLTVNSNKILIPCCEIGEPSESRALIVKNDGDTPLKIDHLLISPPFYTDFELWAGDTLWLDPGDELTIPVYSRPETLGQFKGKMQLIASYKGTFRYRCVELFGYGVPEPGTSVNGLMTDTRWQVDHSPYYINQTVSVPAGGELVIEKGTRVIFTGPYQLTVGPEARLVVHGTAFDSVYFSGLTTETDWSGIFIQNSGNDDTLAYCNISGVKGGLAQSALYVAGSNPEISHTVFADNRTSFTGGAVFLYKTDAILSDCIFRRNVCTATNGGGAIHMRESAPILTNILFYDNQAVNGGAIYCENASPTLINLTVANNWAEQEGGAIYLKGINTLRIRNSIIWHNQAGLSDAPLLQKLSSPNLVLIDYSDIDTVAWEWLGGAISSLFSEAIREGEVNSALDPQFNAPDAGDYRLQTSSPCIDSGDPYDDYYQEPEPNGGRINLGAYGGTRLATITNIATAMEQTHLSVFSLAQNYPNPFNATTTINYELPARSAGGPITNDVELSIFNLLGQKVVTLVNKKQAAGRYQVQWDAGGFATGVYFYRLSAGSFVETKKLVLVR